MRFRALLVCSRVLASDSLHEFDSFASILSIRELIKINKPAKSHISQRTSPEHDLSYRR